MNKSLRIFRNHWLIFLLVLIIFLTRLLIFNQEAAQFWADESRYPILITNIDEASKSGNYILSIQRFFNVDARPGAGLFYFLPAFLEWKNPNIPFGSFYNLIINTLNLILVFFIVKKIQNKNIAVIVTLLITLSVSSFIYMRHMLPYDIALFLLILGLYWYVYFKKTLIFGLLAGLSFLTYPGYYYYIAPIPIILILYKRSIKAGFLFIIGITIIFLSAQLLSNIHTTSYFQSLQEQSGGVTAIHQGDYITAVSYISEYILATDGYWNLFLILAIFPGLFLMKDKKKIGFFAIYLIFVFLILEFFSHILQQHVLYGRTVRPWYLLTISLAVLMLGNILSNFKNKKIYNLGIGILIMVTFINWLPKFLTYKDLVYPKQFQQKARDFLSSKYKNQEVKDAIFVNYWNVGEIVPAHFFHPEKGEPGKYYIMNAVQMFPYYGNYDLNLFCKAQVLLKEPHVQYVFRPYLFEGHHKIMREKMSQDPLYYQLIYCQP